MMLPDFSQLNTNVQGLDEYPLNLLHDMATLSYCSISFTIIIMNILLVNYLYQKDITGYINKKINNKIGAGGLKFILFIVNRYIKVWYKSKDILLWFCLISLFICLLLISFGFYLILAGH